VPAGELVMPNGVSGVLSGHHTAIAAAAGGGGLLTIISLTHLHRLL